MNTSPESGLAGLPYWPYLASAAVLTDFAVDKLLPMGGGTFDILLSAAMLAEHGQPIKTGPAKGRWSLSGNSRRAALTELKHSGGLKEAIAANAGAGRPDNPTQRALDAMLESDAAPSLGQQTLTELLGFERAVDLLQGIVDVPPSFRPMLIGRIERLRLLEPLQRLLVHGFAGREEEERKLRGYVDELESESFKEMMARKLDNVRDIFRARPILVIWGPGGAGKSTLVAKFLLDHSGPQQARPVPFVYLDFDRGQLDPLRPDSMLAEALSQIQIQFPEFAAKAGTLAADAATRIASEDLDSISRSAHFEQSTQLREHFARLVGEISNASGSKVLFFIDTFEVVQRRGSTPVFNVLTLVAELVRAMPRLRPVIVGRAALRDSDFSSYTDLVPHWKPLPVEGFDKGAGRLYLEGRLRKLGKQGVDGAALDRIVALVRGNPLSLRLAAQVFSKQGVGVLEDAVAEAQFDNSFTQERLQGMLHNRIVSVLDERAQKIADPGLIVRRLTPELIQHVLADLCKLEIAGPEDAAQLFSELENEASLFEPIAPGVLRHRPDVRLQMLPLLRVKLGELARTVDMKAVQFWSQVQEPEARAEQIYHLIWLGMENEELEKVWSSGPVSRSLLDDALDEFEALDGPVAARIWLYGKLEREISSELEARADQIEWERHAERRARSLLANNSPKEALSALRARKERAPASPLWMLEIVTLKLMAQDAEALALVDDALKKAVGAHAPEHVVNLVLQKALLLERGNKLQQAFDSAAQAAGLALPLKNDVLQFESQLLKSRLARLLGAAEEAALQQELVDIFDRPAVKDAVRQRASLVREAAAEIGNVRPELFIWLSDKMESGRSDRSGEAASLISAGVAHAQREEPDLALEALEQARRIALDISDDALQARALLQIASVHLELGALDNAMRYLDQTLELAQRTNNPLIEIQARSGQGHVHAKKGDMAGAIPHYELALLLAQQMSYRVGEGIALGNLANVYLALGDLEQAIAMLEPDLQIARELGDKNGEQQTLGNLALAYWKRGDADRAGELYRESLAIAEAIGNQRGECIALAHLGALHVQTAKWDDALFFLSKAYAISRDMGDIAIELGVIESLSYAHARLGNIEEASELLQRQIELLDGADDPQRLEEARRNLAALHAMEEQPGQADAEQLVAVDAIAASGELLQVISENEFAALDFDQIIRDGRSLEVEQSVESARVASSTLLKQRLL